MTIDPQHEKAVALEIHGTRAILILAERMNPTVHLDHQLQSRAEEVDDEIRDGSLPAKLEAIEPARTQCGPEFTLPWRLPPPERPGCRRSTHACHPKFGQHTRE